MFLCLIRQISHQVITCPDLLFVFLGTTKVIWGNLTMNEQQRHLLISQKGPLGDDLDPKNIFSYLLSKFVLNNDEVELINVKATRRGRVEELLRVLREKDSNAFLHFHDALQKTLPHLADLLTSGLSNEVPSNGTESSSLPSSSEMQLCPLYYLLFACLNCIEQLILMQCFFYRQLKLNVAFHLRQIYL